MAGPDLCAVVLSLSESVGAEELPEVALLVEAELEKRREGAGLGAERAAVGCAARSKIVAHIDAAIVSCSAAVRGGTRAAGAPTGRVCCAIASCAALPLIAVVSRSCVIQLESAWTGALCIAIAVQVRLRQRRVLLLSLVWQRHENVQNRARWHEDRLLRADGPTFRMLDCSPARTQLFIELRAESIHRRWCDMPAHRRC